VAVLVNRAALAASLGDKARPDAIDKQVKEIEQLVTSAAGLRKDRGDAVKISVVDFVDSGKDLEPVPAPSFLEIVERQTGTLISAGVILLIAVLLILFGIRPVTRALLAPPPAALEALESRPELDGRAVHTRRWRGSRSSGRAGRSRSISDACRSTNTGMARTFARSPKCSIRSKTSNTRPAT
jgi:flagellar biosynthesis/type III secretory pathway M-ring protein FliF/YscJ